MSRLVHHPLFPIMAVGDEAPSGPFDISILELKAEAELDLNIYTPPAKPGPRTGTVLTTIRHNGVDGGGIWVRFLPPPPPLTFKQDSQHVLMFSKVWGKIKKIVNIELSID